MEKRIDWLNSELIMTCDGDSVLIKTLDDDVIAEVDKDGEYDFIDRSILGLGSSPADEEEQYLVNEALAMIV